MIKTSRIFPRAILCPRPFGGQKKSDYYYWQSDITGFEKLTNDDLRNEIDLNDQQRVFLKENILENLQENTTRFFFQTDWSSFVHTFAFHGWRIKDMNLSRKIKSNLFIRRSFCCIVEVPSPSGSNFIENPKSDLFKLAIWKTSQFDAITISS